MFKRFFNFSIIKDEDGINKYKEFCCFGVKFKKSYYEDCFYKFKNFYRKIKNKRNKKNEYKIIPLGTYCFPRLITTFNGLKPTRMMGEKTCPFDLVYAPNVKTIIRLVDSHFENLYDDLTFDEEKSCWVNEVLKLYFVHDKNLSKEEFIERCNKRICNLYNYFEDKNFHKYILIALDFKLGLNEIEHLSKVLLKFMSKDEFDIIIINQNRKPLRIYKDNLYVIEQGKNANNLKHMYINNDWVGELREQSTPEARKVYNDVTADLKKIIL